jgi:hypothetical protein
LSGWTAANTVGAGLGFPLAIILGLLARGADLPGAFRALSVISFDQLPPELRTQDFINPREAATGVAGGIFLALCQAIILRGRLPRLIPYVLAPALAFVVLFLTVIGPLTLAGYWGYIPGPVEPIVVSLGGAPLTAIVQWFVLRRQGVNATRWMALFVAGIAVGWILLIPLFVLIQNVMGIPVNWGIELLIVGSVLGATAGTMSRNAVDAALARRQRRHAESTSSNE